MSETWKSLQRKATGPEANAEVETWNDLPPLYVMFRPTDLKDTAWRYDDDKVRAKFNVCHAVALRYCYDVKRLNLLGSQSDFMKSVIERAGITKSLSPGQVRGVLNVLGGGLKYNRGRFWKSRGRRRDRDEGLANCLVCGGPLNTDAAVARGVGDTCYRRVMGG